VLADAIRAYHDLLTDDLAAASAEHLDRQLRARGLTFGGRLLCTVLRPRFLTAGQYRLLRDRVRPLLGAFLRAHEAALADPAFRRQFRLTDTEEALLACDPGFRCPAPTSRLDAFVTGPDRVQVTEYNAETPAGAAYTDALAEVFATLPAMRAFARNHRVAPLPARPGVCCALLEAYQEWAGRRDRPVIAILDWREVPTWGEFVLFERYFHEQGLECVLGDPREADYAAGRLVVAGRPVTLVYKRVLIGELLERGGPDQPLVRAVRDGAVCMVNPFRCKVLYKKASLAVLSDERNAGLFTAAQSQAVADCVPWTRVVEERHTEFAGRRVDLVPFVLAHRERLVLKPNDDYGGKGIVLGWTVDAGTWEQAVQGALAAPFVVQERIELPSEPFPALVEGRLHVGERLLDTAPFVCHADFADGCLTRIGTDPLLNVTAGGGSTVPTFLLT
jgi:hypothetical protein